MGGKGFLKGGAKGVQNSFLKPQTWTTPQAWAPKGGAKVIAAPLKGSFKGAASIGGYGKSAPSPFKGGSKGFATKGPTPFTGKGQAFVAKGFGKGLMKGKGKRPSGPNLPRTRVTQEPITGEVLEWKGKFGWVQPSEPIDHPLATRREGKVWVSCGDLQGVEELTVGSLVQFHVYSDASGLGGEEVYGS